MKTSSIVVCDDVTLKVKIKNGGGIVWVVLFKLAWPFEALNNTTTIISQLLNSLRTFQDESGKSEAFLFDSFKLQDIV